MCFTDPGNVNKPNTTYHPNKFYIGTIVNGHSKVVAETGKAAEGFETSDEAVTFIREKLYDGPGHDPYLVLQPVLFVGPAMAPDPISGIHEDTDEVLVTPLV